MARCIPPLSVLRLAAALLLLTSRPAIALNRTVTTLADSGAGSLRSVIAASVDGDSINFAVAGTIVLTSGELGIGRNITINGPGPASLTVQRSIAGGTPDFRIFRISDGTTSGPIVSIAGLTIRNGRVNGTLVTDSGGGILVDHARLTMQDCALTNNQALGGSSGGRGGAIFAYIATGFGTTAVTTTRCTLSGNSAREGAAIYSHAFAGKVDLKMTECTVSGNTSESTGALVNEGFGAIQTDHTGEAEMELNRCTVSGNTGGGIYSKSVTGRGDATVELVQCTVSGNSGSGGDAGGICCVKNSGRIALRVFGSTITGNSASSGGGIYCHAFYPGGTSSDFQLHSTIVAGNSASDGPDVRTVNDATIASAGHNLIGKTNGSIGWIASDLTGVSLAPLDPLLGPLQSNGGPTLTHALLAGSAARDTGAAAGGLGTNDQRGAGFPRLRGSQVDIGAYEASPPPLVVTTIADGNDPVHFTLREAISAANSLPGSTIVFAPGVTGTMQLTAPLPTLNSDMSIQGPGANLLTIRRDTGGDYRILKISNGTTIGPVVSVSGLTLTNGNATGSFPYNSGGAIFNDHGQLTVSRVAVTGNVAASFGGGGGIFNHGANGGSAKLVVNQSTFSGNNGHIGGSAIYNDGPTGGSAVLTVSNSTFYQNAAGFNSATILNAVSGGTASIAATSCTLADNIGSGITSSGPGASATLGHTLLKAGPFGSANLVGEFTSQGYNLSSDAAGGNGGTGPGGLLNGPGDIRNTNPQLDPAGLASNDGQTMTVGLSAGSPAINAGSAGLAPLTDQRGFFRAELTDIGAFESSGVAVRVIDIARQGNDIRITFEGAAERLFRLERNLLLTPGNWQSIPGVLDVLTTSEAPVQISDPGAISLGKAFYRIRLMP